MSERNRPIQPLYIDGNDTLRFKQNDIIRYLIDRGNISLNDIARLPFSEDDRQQLAQLIGYSLDGYQDLSYHSQEVAEIAHRMFLENKEQPDVYLESLKDRCTQLQHKLRQIKRIASK